MAVRRGVLAAALAGHCHLLNIVCVLMCVCVWWDWAYLWGSSTSLLFLFPPLLSHHALVERFSRNKSQWMESAWQPDASLLITMYRGGRLGNSLNLEKYANDNNNILNGQLWFRQTQFQILPINSVSAIFFLPNGITSVSFSFWRCLSLSLFVSGWSDSYLFISFYC